MSGPPEGTLDRPDAAEILRRVGRFLEEEVYGSSLEQKVNYRVKVAANLLHLVRRELELSAGITTADGWITTPEVVERFGTVATLTRALETGEVSIVDRDVYGLLRAHTDLKVGVAAIRPPTPTT